jgi:hypothetical protein
MCDRILVTRFGISGSKSIKTTKYLPGKEKDCWPVQSVINDGLPNNRFHFRRTVVKANRIWVSRACLCTDCLTLEWGEREFLDAAASHKPTVLAPEDRRKGRIRGMITSLRQLKYYEKNAFQYHSVSHNPTWTLLGLNSSLHSVNLKLSSFKLTWMQILIFITHIIAGKNRNLTHRTNKISKNRFLVSFELSISEYLCTYRSILILISQLFFLRFSNKNSLSISYFFSCAWHVRPSNSVRFNGHNNFRRRAKSFEGPH